MRMEREGVGDPLLHRISMGTEWFGPTKNAAHPAGANTRYLLLNGLRQQYNYVVNSYQFFIQEQRVQEVLRIEATQTTRVPKNGVRLGD